MQRYILTGAPGAGKTVLLRALERVGYAVVDEAATDHIALVTAEGVDEHWRSPTFIEDILALQIRRQRLADAWPEPVVFFDRSPICTLALCEYAERQPPQPLLDELAHIEAEGVYERRVFFCGLFDFITPTEARRISLPESRRFEAIHRKVYGRLGYELIEVPPASVAARLTLVRAALG